MAEKKTTFLCKKRVYYFSVISQYGDSFRHFQTISNESAVQWISRLLTVNNIYCHLWFGQIKADLR